MYDATPGSPVTTTIRFLDANGSPITTGIVGTMTLYAPAATVSSGGPTAMAHQGDGAWGVTWAGSLTVATGDYRWVSSAITGTATLAPQAGSAIIGTGDAWSLRELYTAVRLALDDGMTGTSTSGGSTTTLNDTRMAYGSVNRWVASELFLFEPGGVADVNPVRVVTFTPSTGDFLFTPAVTSVASGVDYILGNLDGQGWRHERVMEAIVTACRRFRTLRRVTDAVSLTATATQFEYAPPASWAAVDRVEYLPDATYPDRWAALAPRYARWQPVTRTVRLTMPALRTGRAAWASFPATSAALRITGRAPAPVPQGMGSLVHAPGAMVRDDALYELLLQRPEPEHRQRAAMLAPGVLRARAGAALARF